jgi:ribulose-phosphate 3-epimerase
MPSLYAADPLRIADALLTAVAAGAVGLHFDVMDGNFVPELGLNGPQLEAILEASDLPVDVHLMTRESRRLAAAFSLPGVRAISVHVEAQGVEETRAILRSIRASGQLAWVAISPSTEVEVLREFVGGIDGVLVMSCAPGERGATYVAATPERVAAARGILGPGVEIGVDGGLDDERGRECVRAGADLLVIGRGFFRDPPR